MWRYFPGIFKTPNKKDAKVTPQKADSREYEMTRSGKFSSKKMMVVLDLDDNEGIMSDYESDTEMSEEIILEKLNHL